MKMHFKVVGPDCRNQGQTDYEFNHTAACGYVRKAITESTDRVDCFYCLKQMERDRVLNKLNTQN